MRGRRWRVKARLRVGLAATALVALAASSASAELTQHGSLLLDFNGSITPRALPRHDAAPIAVYLAGRIRSLSGERPPALRRITIALNRKGRLDTDGLPLCSAARLRSTTSKAALRICHKAQVGHGSFASTITFPGAPALPAHGRLLAFNARLGGRRAILVHLYGTDPVPVTRILFFHLSRGSGSYGTTLSAPLPVVFNRWGYLKRLSLILTRRFSYRGKHRSYISASCPAPAGFPAATFPFAHATFSFADHRALSSTVVRSCRVRG